MALTKVINDLADLNQSGSTNALKGCAGTTAQQPSTTSDINYLIVGGGGAANTATSGGGGAGGLLTGTTTVYHGTPTVITIGEGGATANSGYSQDSYSGNDSGFNGIRAIGGGAAPRYTAYNKYSLPGGSGSGASIGTGDSASSQTDGGLGVSGQGNNGGANAALGNPSAGGGGGGAGAVGTSGSSGTGGGGGIGSELSSFITYTDALSAGIGEVSGTNVYFAGGGGAGGYSGGTYTQTPGTGGLGGGGNGNNSSGNGEDGAANTGGGAGGGDGTSAVGIGGSGGSGVGVLKYDNTIVTGYTLNSEDTYTVNWPASTFGIAYWPLNLNVKDVGGHYDGTATDITYTNGQFNQAASFNGSSSYIDTTFFVPPTSSLSSSVWFKTSSTAYRHYLFGDFNGGGSDLSARFSLNVNASNNFEVIFGDGSTSDTWNSISASSYLDGNWHNVVLTGNGTALKLYVDGSLIGTDTFLVPVGTAGAQSMVLGRPGGYNGVYWNGQLEQMRFYASELSLTDVQDIYNNSKPGSLPPLKTSSDLTTTETSFPSGATTLALYTLNGNAVADPSTYNGADSNVSYVSGKFGECGLFDGSSVAADIVLGSSFISAFDVSNKSFSLWFNWDGSNPGSNGYGMPFFMVGSGLSNGRIGVQVNNSNGALDAFAGGAGSYPATTIVANKWYHFALAVSGSSYEAFVNGSSIGTATNDNYTDAGTDTAAIGSYFSSNYYFCGNIDQVRFYASALTAQQIYDLWQKENDIQTYFPNSSTDTDTLVFKSGSGEITFKNDSPPGGEIGMLRYNSTLSGMEHFNAGGWKKFLSPLIIETLIVGGGGGSTNLCGAGGAGAGGVLSGSLSALKTNTDYSIQVGAGGTGSPGPSYSTGYTNGSNSFVSGWIANGGGYSAGAGGFFNGATWPTSGNAGGSGGGGGGFYGNGSATTGGASNQTSIAGLTGYGNDGGSHVLGVGGAYTGAGGGGAGAVGQSIVGYASTGGTGGVGVISTIIDTTIASANSVGQVSGSDVYFAGGGGGDGDTGAGYVNGSGGLGGGGSNNNAGTAATGGGAAGASCGAVASSGGSGVVILKYPSDYTCTLSGATGLTEIVDTSVSGFKISIFKVSSEGTNGTGTIKFTA